MALDQETLRRKNEELSSAYKEKNRKLLQMQELYDKLKRKAMLGHIQDAASDAVNTTLHIGTTMAAHHLGRNGHQGTYDQQFETPYDAPRYADRLDQNATMSHQALMGPPNMQNAAWARPARPRGMCEIPSTPSTHRQRLGESSTGLSAVPGLVAGTPVGLRGEGRMRQPLGEMQLNQRPNVDNFTRAGLSSHLKTGQGRDMTATGFVSTARPKVAERPAVPRFSAGSNM